MLDDLNKFFSTLSAPKLVIISICTLAAFWYLNIFLFDRKIIESEKFQIPIIISFCLGFLWNMVTTVLSFTLFRKPQQTQSLYPERDHLSDQEWTHRCLFWNIFASVITISACTLLELFISFNFKTYVLISFSLLVILTLIRSYLLTKTPKVNKVD